MYITFDEYRNLGGVVTDETTFNRLETKSELEVDYVTANRLQKIEPSRVSNLKILMLELVDNANISFTADSLCQEYGGSISSISNDGVSISLSANSNMGNRTAKKENMRYRYRLIQQYLPEYSYRGLIERGMA